MTDNDGWAHTVRTSIIVTEPSQDLTPVAVNDSANTQAGTSVTIDLLANDQEGNDALDLSSVTITQSPRQGTVTVHDDGSVTYTHQKNDTFTYTIRDANGKVSNVATVTVDIQ